MAKILDLDDDTDTDSPPKTMLFRWLGREWHLLTEYNQFAFAGLTAAPENNGTEQTKAFHKIIVTLVVREEREDWTNAIVEANVPLDKLVAKMQQLLAAAGKDDSPSPATSSGTAAPRPSKRRSTVSSS